VSCQKSCSSELKVGYLFKSDTNSKDHSRVGSSRRSTVEEMETLEVTFYSPSGRGETLLRKVGSLHGGRYFVVILCCKF
jgi:hypothetical protein